MGRTARGLARPVRTGWLLRLRSFRVSWGLTSETRVFTKEITGRNAKCAKVKGDKGKPRHPVPGRQQSRAKLWFPSVNHLANLFHS